MRQQIYFICIFVMLMMAGCVNQEQLFWNYQQVSVSTAVHIVARRDRNHLFNEGQVQLLLGRPDTEVSSSGTAKVDGDLLQAAAASFAQYWRRDYARPAADHLPLAAEERDAFKKCRLWVYVENLRYARPLHGRPFARYVIVFQNSTAVSSAIAPTR